MDAEVKSGREYLRVSFDRSGRERSNAEQEEDNRRVWVGWSWGVPYSDATSASRYATKVRDDWVELIGDLRAGRFAEDALVLWESSRGSRRVGEWVELLDLLEARGKKVAVTEHRRVYDPAVPRDRRSLLEDAVDSEYESAKTSRRVRRGAAANAAAGRPHGRVPYGYKRVYDEGTGRLVGQVPEEGEAAVVRELFERIAQGHSLRRISMDLAARGVRGRRGKVLSPPQLRGMALADVYRGKRVHVPGRRHGRRDASLDGDVLVYDAQWPPLVDNRTWLAVQRILKDPNRRTNGSRPGRAVHLLSMIARCDVCPAPMSRKLRSGKEFYYCHVKGCVRVPKQELDDLATAAMIEFLSQPETIEQLGGDEDTTAELEAVREEIAGIKTELDELAEELGDGKISPALAARSEPRMLARLRAAEQREEALATPPALRELMKPGEDVAQRWQQAPMSTKRRVAKLLLSPAYLGELRVRPSPIPRHHVPIEDRVVWRTHEPEDPNPASVGSDAALRQHPTPRSSAVG
jgi:site-specific DNA recombinase